MRAVSSKIVTLIFDFVKLNIRSDCWFLHSWRLWMGCLGKKELRYPPFGRWSSKSFYFPAGHKSQQGLCSIALLLTISSLWNMKYFSLLNSGIFSFVVEILKWLDAICLARTKGRVTRSLISAHTVWIKTFNCTTLLMVLFNIQKQIWPIHQ